jgi:multidrug transporter EmrE-like cation transporter
MWFLLMLVVLLTNGMSSFGLKMLAGWQLPGVVKFPYLTVWYAAGLASITFPSLVKGFHIGKKETVLGALMAILSIGGQVAMAKALDLRVPGNIVFPVAIGGSILVVAIAGWAVFRERMHRLTAAGVVLGFVAVILLSMS